MVNDKNFEYDVLLGLDLISNFWLKQEYGLSIFQRLDSDTEEKVELLNYNRKNQEY